MILPPSGTADDLGIVLCTDHRTEWQGVPREFAERVTTAQDAAELVSSMVDRPDPWPVSLQRTLLHPSSAVPAALAPVRAGGTALDLGTGWFGLAPALASFGVETTRADWIYSRLRFARLVHPVPGITDVLVEPLRLPDLTTARFDAIFLDLNQFPATAHAELLSGARRLLMPGGAVVAGVTDRRAGLIRTASFAQALRTPSSRAVVRRAGMQVHAAHFALPDRAAPQVVVPTQRLAEQLSVRRRYTGAKALALRLLRAVNGIPLLARDRLLVLTPTGAGTEPSAAGRALGEEGEPLVLALSDARVGVLGTERFAKVALSTDQQHALMAEADRTTGAGGTAFGPHVVEPQEVGRTDGIMRVSYPAVAARTVPPEAAAAAIDTVLDRLDRAPVSALARTPLWRRLVSERGQRDITDLHARPLWEWLSRRCHDSTVPVGPNHGDLHPDNVLVPAGSGRPVLVDWNRFEEGNPLVLDPLYAALNIEREITGCSFAEAFERAAKDSLTGPLAVRTVAVRGDLEALEAAVLLLLDRIASYSLPRRRFKPWTLPQFEDATATLLARVNHSFPPRTLK